MKSEAISSAIVTTFAVVVSIWAVWATVIAFVGGTVPVLGFTLDGSLATGLLWMFVIVPVLEIVTYWVAVLVSIPVALLLGATDSDQ